MPLPYNKKNKPLAQRMRNHANATKQENHFRRCIIAAPFFLSRSLRTAPSPRYATLRGTPSPAGTALQRASCLIG